MNSIDLSDPEDINLYYIKMKEVFPHLSSAWILGYLMVEVNNIHPLSKEEQEEFMIQIYDKCGVV